MTVEMNEPLLTTDQDISINLKSEIESLMAAQKNKYDFYKIPASIEKAIIHKQCSRVTKKKKKTDDKSNEIVRCGCCGGTSGERLSYLYPPTRFYGRGDAIPLYFNYVFYSMGILILFLLHGLIYINEVARVTCRPGVPNEKAACDSVYISMFLHSDVSFAALFEVLDTPVYQLSAMGLVVSLVLLEFYFSWRRMRILNRTRVSLSALNYTVMVANVAEDDPDEQIEEFLRNRIRKDEEVSKELEIVKINRTSSCVVQAREENALKDLKANLKALEGFQQKNHKSEIFSRGRQRNRKIQFRTH